MPHIGAGEHTGLVVSGLMARPAHARDVSRTHRVYLDWLVETINFEFEHLCEIAFTPTNRSQTF